MILFINKEVADELRCSVETLLARMRLVNFSPTFGGHNYHRWSRADVDEFIKRWSEHTKKNAIATPSSVGARTRNSVPKKTQGNRRDGQRAGNRAVHRAADGKRVAATERAGARTSNP